MPKLISRTKDKVEADLKDDTNATGMVDFRSVKNSSEDCARANIRDSAGVKRIVNFSVIDSTQ